MGSSNNDNTVVVLIKRKSRENRLRDFLKRHRTHTEEI